jgi:hypothetical protein
MNCTLLKKRLKINRVQEPVAKAMVVHLESEYLAGHLMHGRRASGVWTGPSARELDETRSHHSKQPRVAKEKEFLLWRWL